MGRIDLQRFSEMINRLLYFSELMGTAFDLPGREKWWAKHLVRPDTLLRSVGLD